MTIIQEISFSGGKARITGTSMIQGGGCTGVKYEEAVARMVSSGNYHLIRTYEFDKLMNKVEELYREIESLEGQNSQVVVRANSQSSSLQRQLQMREEQIELGRSVLENSRSLIMRMQSQLENKDSQLEIIK
ncbi:hypothetical protein [endosymbiont GvMRE of Glomus versiforme]|uniref:hypothetical protein n=1 Tax=endosymbiont GvMRE of Glomus versiforme TaxID=2039283 RepID=UPI000EE84569|nr:hypothetical protein [endosymbiont GvMRE of Glomus versiforme]RHZ36848.1 hypothetical protein GvMRE_I2g589 [endosymbiont GvMRE of Glomus versiforme]